MKVLVLVLFGTLFAALAIGQAPPAQLSPQLLEQVSRLPRAQQEALAKQYGVNLPRLIQADPLAELAVPQAGNIPGHASLYPIDEESVDLEMQAEEWAKLNV